MAYMSRPADAGWESDRFSQVSIDYIPPPPTGPPPPASVFQHSQSRRSSTVSVDYIPPPPPSEGISPPPPSEAGESRRQQGRGHELSYDILEVIPDCDGSCGCTAASRLRIHAIFDVVFSPTSCHVLSLVHRMCVAATSANGRSHGAVVGSAKHADGDD